MTNCSDQELEALLDADDVARDFPELAVHVDQCRHCQGRLERLAGEPVDWCEAKRWLGDGDPSQRDDPMPVRFHHGQSQSSAWTAAMAKQLLSPPSHPEMMGRIGRYEIERLIGVGGMGIVFKGFDAELNRPVAVKVLAPYLAGSGSARKRFAREARAAAAVVDEHVVAIHNVESTGESPFLVMRYVAGESLQRRLDRSGPLEVREVLRIGMQMANGLAAAHAQGLIHRDVKPSNILLEESVDRALLTDFGLARAGDDASLTHSGYHPGTPQYMSPEQARGQAVSYGSDLFSLGSVLYFMCTGRSPFRAETTMGVLRRITDESPRPIRTVNSEIPDWLEAIISKMLAKEPKHRFRSAHEVADLLGQWLAHLQQPSAVPRPSPTSTPPNKPASSAAGPGRRVPRWILTLGAVAMLFIAVVIIFVRLGETTVRLEIDDPSLAVHFGKETITFENDGSRIHITPGETNTFVISRDDGSEIVGTSLQLRKGQKVVLRVSNAPDGNIKVMSDQYQMPLSNLPPPVSLPQGDEQSTGRSRHDRNLVKELDAKNSNKADPRLQKETETQTPDPNDSSGLRPLPPRIAPSPRRTINLGDPVYSVEYSPDGKFVAAAAGRLIHLLEAESGSLLRRIDAHSERVWRVTFSPDGKLLASGSRDRTVRFWNLSSGEQQGNTLQCRGEVRWLAFSPDGMFVAAAEDAPTGYPIDFWRVPDGKKIGSLAGATGTVLEMAFSPAGDFLVSAESERARVHVWDVETIKMLWTARHPSGVTAVCISRDGKTVATGAWDNSVRLWDADNGKMLNQIRAPGTSGTESLVWSPDSRWLLSGHRDGTITIMDAVSGEIARSFEAHRGPVFDLHLSPDQRTLVSCGSADHTLQFWDVELSRPGVASAPRDLPDETVRRDSLAAEWRAITELEKSADEFEPLTTRYCQTLMKAAEKYNAFYRKYRAQKVGIIARLYEARCYQRQQKHAMALSILDQLRQQLGQGPEWSDLRNQVSNMAAACRQASQKSEANSPKPIKQQPPNRLRSSPDDGGE